MVRLAIRISPIGHETISGYLLSLSEANRYENLRHLVTGLGLAKSFATRPCNLDTVENATDGFATCVQLRSLALWPSESYARRLNFGKHAVSPICVSASHPKVCCFCLSEGLPVRRLWDLKCYLACPRHNVMLTARCDSCDRSLSWFRRAALRCECGSSLKPSDQQPSQSVVSVARTLEAFDQGVQASRKALAPVTSIDAAARLVWFGGTHHSDQANWRSLYISKPSMETALPIVERGASLLLDWPRGIGAWLSEHRRPGKTALSQVYGPLLERMKNCFDIGFEEVLEQVRLMLSTGPEALLIRRASYFYKTKNDGAARYLTGAEAARRLFISARTVEKHLKSGELTGESRRAGSRNVRIVDVESVENIFGLRGKSFSSKAVAEMLGISSHQMDNLRLAGLIGAKESRPGSTRIGYSYPIREIEDFLKKLEAISQVASVQEAHVRLTDVPSLHLIKLSDLLRSILRGNTPLFRDCSVGSENVLLDAFHVSYEALVGSRDRGGERSVSVAVAAAKLHVSVRMIPVLVKAGCLDAVLISEKVGKCSVSSRSLATFTERYVLTSTLAVAADTNTRNVIKQLSALGVAPIISSNTGRGISAVWRKKDIAHLRIGNSGKP